MDGFFAALNGVKDREWEDKAFWVGHSLFQLPFRILDYKGSAEALVLTYLFERASSISFYSTKEVLIEIPIKQKTIADRTGLSENAVSGAIVNLEADQAIRVTRRRDPKTKQIRLSVYLLLHSQTLNPLLTSPGIFGVLHQNFDRPFISAPKETRTKLMLMKPAGRAAYLSALALASKRVSTSFGIIRLEWKTESHLGRNAFDRGVKECKRAKLLTYKRQVLTINDPVTGAPSMRRGQERIIHENTNWKFDLNTVTPEQWQQIVSDLLKKEFLTDSSGWSRTQRGILCPFCKAERSFSVNFHESQYVCHQNCGQHSRGRLGQLVARVLHVRMIEAKGHIQDRIAEMKTVTGAERAA